jgi:septum formation protein
MIDNLKFILASKSPRRKQILEWAAIPFQIITEETAEEYPESMPKRNVPKYLATLKGSVIHNKVKNTESSVVIAADTIVLFNEKIFGKPVNREDAVRILSELSGNMHEVITGVSIHWQNNHFSFSETTRVWFSPITQSEIEFYVDNYKPYDKAGSYAIQEWIGVTTIQKVEGCFFNVMGLPMNRLYHELKKLELID